MRKIATLNFKGGTGLTTAVVNLSHALAEHTGTFLTRLIKQTPIETLQPYFAFSAFCEIKNRIPAPPMPSLKYFFT